MPTYEYRCTKCDNLQDIFHDMNDTKIYRCEKCGARLKKKVSGGTGIIYRCKGFTNTGRT